MRDIGNIISENRKRLKLTQSMLAEKLEQNGISISYKTISGWEQGVSEPGDLGIRRNVQNLRDTGYL